jgi:hypothetical protein
MSSRPEAMRKISSPLARIHFPTDEMAVDASLESASSEGVG